MSDSENHYQEKVN
ncbi:Protein of unknown function [Bacillus wiedmannii]|nr:Protein of unknown function [Bacillus wiedmannii]